MASKKYTSKKRRGKKRLGRRLLWGTAKGVAKGGWWLTRKTGKGLWRGGKYLADEERLARAYRRIRDRTVIRLDRPTWGRAYAAARRNGGDDWYSGSADWYCLGCKQSGSWSAAKGHVCRAAPLPTPASRRPVIPKSKPVPRASSTSKGASIVAPNTAAQRFAYLSGVLPETAGEWEQLAHDLFSGVLMLASEIAGIAEDADIDGRVKDALIKLSDQVADLAEPARDVRTVFRTTYALHLEAAASGVKLPANRNFFEDAG